MPQWILTSSKSLNRVMLEGNPLTHETMGRLFSEAKRSWVTTLSLDDDQLRRFFAAEELLAWDDRLLWKSLPEVVTS